MSPGETRKSLLSTGAPSAAASSERHGADKSPLCSFLSVGGGLTGARSRSALDVCKLVELEQSAHSSGSKPVAGSRGGGGKGKEKEGAGGGGTKFGFGTAGGGAPVDLLSVARAAAATERALIAQNAGGLRRAHSKRERGSQGTLETLPAFAQALMTEKAAKSKERSSQSLKQKLSRRSKRRGKNNEARCVRVSAKM